MDIRIPHLDAERSIYSNTFAEPLRHFNVLGPRISCVLESDFTGGAADGRQVLHASVGDVNAVGGGLATRCGVARKLGYVTGAIANREGRRKCDCVSRDGGNF